MTIDSSRTPDPPLNGLIRLATRQGPNRYEEVDLDFDDYSRRDGNVTFHCYDTAGNTVHVVVKESVIEHVVFGPVADEQPNLSP